jgi:hypothetical protein
MYVETIGMLEFWFFYIEKGIGKYIGGGEAGE